MPSPGCIESGVERATLIAYEGSKLLNLVLLLLMENSDHKITRDANWIHTFMSVSVAAETEPRPSPCQVVEFVRQKPHQPLRPSGSRTIRTCLNRVLSYLARETAVNCRNHVAENFERRLGHWRYGLLLSELETPLSSANRHRLRKALFTASMAGSSGFGLPATRS